MKKTLLLILCIPYFSSSQCVLGDCQNGYGVYKESNGDIYSGQWKDGMKNGLGYLEIKEGGYYIGQFKNDTKDGYCLILFPQGNKYFGEMKENKKSGFAYYEYPNDIGFYRGEFSDNLRNGIGLYTDVSGEKDRYYYGNWMNDEIEKKRKKGKKKLKVGCLAGKCRKDKGLYVSDRVSLGYWVKGKMNGKGLLTTSNLGIGNFKNNKFNGKGLYLRGATQEIYFGKLKDGRQQDGHGMVRRIDGEIFIGEMLEGEVNNGNGISIVQIKNKPNEYFVGEWNHGKVVEIESYIFTQ